MNRWLGPAGIRGDIHLPGTPCLASTVGPDGAAACAVTAIGRLVGTVAAAIDARRSTAPGVGLASVGKPGPGRAARGCAERVPAGLEAIRQRAHGGTA